VRGIWPRYRALLRKKRHVKKKFKIGFVCRALIIRGRHWIKRKEGVFLRFDENAVILLSRRTNIPFAKRFKGPIAKELCLKFPNIGSIANYII
jgi:large subunit ribosomal protein L14